MGLVENILERLTFRSVALFLTAGAVIQYAVGRVWEYWRLKRLGNLGWRVPSYAPFGTSCSLFLSSLANVLRD
jgi:hypothetical protein